MACPMSALQREMFCWLADGLNGVRYLNALVMQCRGGLPSPLPWRTSIYPLGCSGPVSRSDSTNQLCDLHTDAC